jgi:hypothetical protein
MSADYRYWASCPNLSYELAAFIPDEASEITYQTFRRYVGREAMLDNPWGEDALYRISCADNWSRQFFKSRLPTGIPTYYLVWSRYEIYFVPGDVSVDMRKEETALAIILHGPLGEST